MPANAASVANATLGVVIPVYNRRTTLLETLPYVLRQTRLPDRLVIADDGSSDGTPEAADDWLAAQRPAFDWTVIRLRHATAAGARAAGYERLGRVDRVAFLDSDDHWPSDFLARTEAALAAEPAAVAATTGRRFVGGDGGADTTGLPADPIGWLFRHGGGVASCSLLRATAYEAVGGWDARLEMAEDLKLFATLAQQGPWIGVPGEPVEYTVGRSAAVGEEGNLTGRYECGNFVWARVYERVLRTLQERDPRVATPAVRSAMARVWRSAGRELQRIGHAATARECYQRSLGWRRLQYHAWRRLLLSYAQPSKNAAAAAPSLPPIDRAAAA